MKIKIDIKQTTKYTEEEKRRIGNLQRSNFAS